MGRPRKAPLYVLPHGIEVIGEYAPTKQNPYWRARIRPHAFFADVTERCGGIYVRRSRVLLAAKLGRALTSADIAHHGDEDKQHDSPQNLVLQSAAEHNQHHKTGARHSTATRARIAEGVRRSYAEGRHPRSAITNRDDQGRIAA